MAPHVSGKRKDCILDTTGWTGSLHREEECQTSYTKADSRWLKDLSLKV